MKDLITPLNWSAELVDVSEYDAIDKDFVLLDNPIISSEYFKFPFKVDVTTAIIILKGSLKGKIDLKLIDVSEPAMVIVMYDQILQYEYISNDFSGLFIVMSKKFTESLNIEDRLPVFFSVAKHPVHILNDEEVNAMKMYYEMMRTAIRIKDNPFRMEIARNLTRAFFYGAGYQFHNIEQNEDKTRYQLLVEDFLKYVQENFKEHRDLKFYADKLCLTQKYLAKVIRENSELSAGEWISKYVILEASALLKSTNMTIQQISDSLNFPSQSFFGKYFKRHVGVSPSSYRDK